MDSPLGVEIYQWILDTRPLWPSVTGTQGLRESAAWALLPGGSDEEQNLQKAVLKYRYVRDAKMSLVSHLLKHYVVALCCPEVPWRDIKITRNSRGKPVFVHPATGRQPVVFNVSHQAGVVALVAVAGYPDAAQQEPPHPKTAPALERGDVVPGVEVGIDVVCSSERRAQNHEAVRVGLTSGWPRFVDVYADVFSPREVSHLKYSVLSAKSPPFAPGTTQDEILDYKLRCFYALWCLREAYLKMTGEGLVSEGLTELEFRNFAPPPPPAAVAELDDGSLALQMGSQPVTDHEIFIKGQRDREAQVCLQSLGRDYMVCTAVRTPGSKAGLEFELISFTKLTIEHVYAAVKERLGHEDHDKDLMKAFDEALIAESRI